LLPIRPRDLDPVQRELYDDMCASIATGFDAFRSADGDGAMIGLGTLRSTIPRSAVRLGN
jgi:hypothetical protein